MSKKSSLNENLLDLNPSLTIRYLIAEALRKALEMLENTERNDLRSVATP